MNKKVITNYLCLILILLLSGCVNSNNEKVVSNSETTIIKSVSDNSADNNVIAVPSTSTKENKSDEDTTKTTEVDSYIPESTSKDYSEIGFELIKEESLFVLDNAIAGKDVIKQIGEPEEKSEAIIWGADGLEHQTWYYKERGLELDFVRDNTNTQIINSISISDPSKLKTIRGIGIGNTEEEVIKAYGNEINQEDSSLNSNSIVVGSIYGGVIFKIENDRVASIYIGAAAE